MSDPSLFLRSLAASPLARHPALAWRKARRRLGLAPASAGDPAPPAAGPAYPPHWPARLRDWFGRCGLSGGPVPDTRVFGRDVPADLLLELCRRGPRAAADLTGDVKLPWEFARGHAHPLNAALAPAAGRDDAARRIAAAAAAVMAAGDAAGSPVWSSPMDAAIRAVNWVAADALLDGAVGRAVGADRWRAWLWRHLQFIWTHLEAFRVSSNHYLSNLLGLLVLGRCFAGLAEADRRLRFARREWPAALRAQTHADGGVYEASLRYHALVTEMALLAELFEPGLFAGAARERLARMADVVAAHLDAGGDVFPVGDDDGGRILAADFAAPARGRGECLLELAALALGAPVAPPGATALFPDSGWWTARAGDFHVHLEFGGVGAWGEGGHAHDDTNGVCVTWRGQPFLADPGSYLYTPDPAARNRFRSAARHSVLRLRPAGAPAAEPDFGRPFIFRGDLRPLPAAPAGPGGVSIRHEQPPAGRVDRRVQVATAGVTITDTIASAGDIEAEWRLQLHPDVSPEATRAGYRLTGPGGALDLACDHAAVAWRVEESAFAPGYGTAIPARQLVGRARLCDRQVVTLTLGAAP